MAGDDDEEGRLFARPPRTPPPPAPAAVSERAVMHRAWGVWTSMKLDIFDLYLKQYRRVASGTYLDCFAGGGSVEVSGELKHGSAALAAQSGAFRTLHLFEKDDATRKLLEGELRRWVPLRKLKLCRVVEPPGSDCNVGVPALLQSGQIDPTRPCFAFLDPNSTELAWDLVEALAAFKTLDTSSKPPQCKVETWTLFNLNQAIQRLWVRRKSSETMPLGLESLDRVFGGRSAWFDLWEAGAPSAQLMTRYVELLRDELGYLHVSPQAIKDKPNGRTMYWMIHASDHSAAPGFMAWATSQQLKSTPNAPTRLPGM